MALTKTQLDEGTLGGRTRFRTLQIVFDNSYPAGGYAISAAELGLPVINAMLPVGGNAASGRYNFWFDTVNSKLMILYPTGGAATSPAAVADPVTTSTVAAGATAVTSTGAQPAIAGVVTPGRGKELAATTDVSSLTVNCMFLGS